MLENGLEVCNCKKKNCVRHGKCAECLEHHRTNKRYPPYCKRDKDKGSRKNRNSDYADNS